MVDEIPLKKFGFINLIWIIVLITFFTSSSKFREGLIGVAALLTLTLFVQVFWYISMADNQVMQLKQGKSSRARPAWFFWLLLIQMVLLIALSFTINPGLALCLAAWLLLVALSLIINPGSQEYNELVMRQIQKNIRYAKSRKMKNEITTDCP
ncbi:hypothetical protein KEM60_01128 [Austwickia sp. TVS 96-490-7B]|uniref:hypothetical protein n=1 Tax=Austwickia sp. TVS 96-490-7B TaxID=2830843 RepID=UPI001C562B5B|nr:hypothetical protein [Austwickia sp. TVS 96-490-7B]MBW3084937.1 hypothetical protein [Austwickia sp. TVS 96-490-7B]